MYKRQFLNRHALEPESLDPRYWYPIRDSADPLTSHGDVVAYPYSTKDTNEFDRLYVGYLLPNSMFYQHKVLNGAVIGDTVQTDSIASNDYPVVPVRSREGFYGTSDFIDIGEYVLELHRRESASAMRWTGTRTRTLPCPRARWWSTTRAT